MNEACSDPSQSLYMECILDTTLFCFIFRENNMHEYTDEVQTLLDWQLTIDAWIQLSNCENSRAWKKVLS